MLPVYAYGHDFGNSETGGVLLDRTMAQQMLTLPSETALGSLHDLIGMRSGFSECSAGWPSDALGQGEYVLEYHESEWFVGTLALKQTRDASSGRGDINRYASPRSLHLLLTTSALLLPPHIREYHLHVVTGLPVESFANADLRRRVKHALEGEHHFTLNGVPRLAVVRVMKTMMEGAGAIIAHGDESDTTQGCIDIGGRTTDLFVAEGQSPVLPLCKGKVLGMEAAADLVSAQFSARYHRPLKASERREILHASVQSRLFPVLFAQGMQVPEHEVWQWTQHALATIGGDIASFVSTVWNTSEAGAVGSDIGRVLLVGGGAYYVADVLRARIPHLVIPQRPELANALGYAALAYELSQRSRQSM